MKDLILCKMKNGSQNSNLTRKEDLGDRIPNFGQGQLHYIAQDFANTVEPFCFLNKWVCSRNPRWRTAWSGSYLPRSTVYMVTNWNT